MFDFLVCATQVPANKMGYSGNAAILFGTIKVIQEVISVS
jgi:uncharacterized protein (DUF486 family)